MAERISLKHLILSFSILATLSSCGSPSSEMSAGNPAEAVRPVILNLRTQPGRKGKLKVLSAVSSPIASIEIEVRGESTVLASVKVPAVAHELLTIKLDILTGAKRRFLVIARNEEGELVLEGQTTVDIEASEGETPQVVAIEMKVVLAPPDHAFSFKFRGAPGRKA